ncbi:MAG: adenylate/guanylate cyclase domain-containing protein, partial [Candidatus Eremiobacteraeota bacterium]|nr:adenylate/guanylate cyclase domain-containing protein [Candidatus Eremiobacteraeota bacterium]
MTEAPLPSGTVTFLFTDIEGSTQRWDRDRAAMQEAVRRHDTILRAAIEGGNGRVFKTIGDAFCAVFARAEEGVAAAVGAQRELAKEDFSAVDGVRVRMALHTGTADEREGDYYGPTLNRVARLLSIGHGGQILITRVTADLLRGHLVPGVSAHDMGLHKLKDLSDAELVHQLLVEGLEQEFPPLRSSGATPNNLPAQVSSFVGRENESAAVTDLLHANRLVTLLGTGGIGKTRLSLHVAGEQLEAFPNGIWFVEFAPLSDAALVADSIGSAANVAQSAERPALDTLLAHFKNETALLIFDNCEHLVAEIARVADALLKGCPKLKILASSRELLNVPGEQAYRMPTLGPAEAMALFAERAKTADQRFGLTPENEPAVAEICRRLDGIALAIELAAARVKLLSPKALLEKLNDRFRVLTGGSRTNLPRQQTLRALIDWSYDLLSEKERTLFPRLAIFSGGFTLELCAAVCADEALDEFEVMDLLVALVDKSLVSPEIVGDETRYTLLESIREYAREKLAEAGEVDALSRAHAAAFTDFAERLDGALETMAEAAWVAQAKPELENWRGALTWALGGENDSG